MFTCGQLILMGIILVLAKVPSPVAAPRTMCFRINTVRTEPSLKLERWTGVPKEEIPSKLVTESNSGAQTSTITRLLGFVEEKMKSRILVAQKLNFMRIHSRMVRA